MTDKAFGRLHRKTDQLAARIISEYGKTMQEMPDNIAPRAFVEGLATALMAKDNQFFKWLLESYAALKMQEKEAAEMNLHPDHDTFN